MQPGFDRHAGVQDGVILSGPAEVLNSSAVRAAKAVRASALKPMASLVMCFETPTPVRAGVTPTSSPYSTNLSSKLHGERNTRVSTFVDPAWRIFEYCCVYF